jgi:hypothetical protein
MLTPWTEDDVKRHAEFDDQLSKLAKWEGSTADMVKLYRSLVWFAQLRDKIKNSIASDVKVYSPEDIKAKAASAAATKE